MFKKSVLLIDIDPQGNSCSSLNIDKNTDKSIYEVLLEKIDINDAIFPTSIKNLSIVPVNQNLAGAQIEMVDMIAREFRLKNGKVADVRSKLANAGSESAGKTKCLTKSL